MLNTWDFAFLLLFLGAAWLGWRLKALPLIGLGMAFCLAPMGAQHEYRALADFIVDKMGGRGLMPHQDQVAWWILFVSSASVVFLFAVFVSQFLKDLQLEFLDQGFGAFILVTGLFLALGINGLRWAQNLRGESYQSLTRSWTWNHLQFAKEPPWIQSLAASFESLKLPQKL